MDMEKIDLTLAGGTGAFGQLAKDIAYIARELARFGEYRDDWGQDDVTKAEERRRRFRDIADRYSKE